MEKMSSKIIQWANGNFCRSFKRKKWTPHTRELEPALTITLVTKLLMDSVEGRIHLQKALLLSMCDYKETFQQLQKRSWEEKGDNTTQPQKVLCSFSEEDKMSGNTVSDRRGNKLSLWADISMSVFSFLHGFCCTVNVRGWDAVQIKWLSLRICLERVVQTFPSHNILFHQLEIIPIIVPEKSLSLSQAQCWFISGLFRNLL